MALQSSGQITHTDIATEFGYSTSNFSLNADGVPILNGLGESRTVGVSQVAESDFYGLSASDAVDGQYDTLWGSTFDNANKGGGYNTTSLKLASDAFAASNQNTTNEPPIQWHSGTTPYSGPTGTPLANNPGGGTTDGDYPSFYRSHKNNGLSLSANAVRCDYNNSGFNVQVPGWNGNGTTTTRRITTIFPIQKLRTKTYNWEMIINSFASGQSGAFYRQTFYLRSYTDVVGGVPTNLAQTTTLWDSGNVFPAGAFGQAGTKSGTVSVSGEYCFGMMIYQTNNPGNIQNGGFNASGINFRP